MRQNAVLCGNWLMSLDYVNVFIGTKNSIALTHRYVIINIHHHYFHFVTFIYILPSTVTFLAFEKTAFESTVTNREMKMFSQTEKLLL